MERKMRFGRIKPSMLNSELVYAINFLLRQLSKKAKECPKERIRKVLKQSQAVLIGVFTKRISLVWPLFILKKP